MATEEEAQSRIERLTAWGRARAILQGKSRGRNLIVLGIFLIVLSGVFTMVNKLLFDSEESMMAAALLVLGIFAVIWGAQAYLAGE